MRKMLLITALMVLAMPLAAHAQKAEIFGGYSYLRGDDCDDNSGPNCDGGLDLHGFNVSFNQNLVKWAGLKLDISGHYGDVTVIPGQPKFDLDTYLFLAGPQFNLPKFARLRPYGHVLLGVMRVNVTSFGALGRTSVRDSAFALAVGGGLDVKVTDLVAVRLFQADYILTTFDSERQNNIRASTGVVFRFGEN
ncbi:MAG: outer membrane beta-barrel protein [Blastocatellia bacterium]